MDRQDKEKFAPILHVTRLSPMGLLAYIEYNSMGIFLSSRHGEIFMESQQPDFFPFYKPRQAWYISVSRRADVRII